MMRKNRAIAEHELSDLLKAMMNPVRPYGSIFLYTGGAQKSLRGNYPFFEMDQNRIGGVINQLNKSGIGEHIYCIFVAEQLLIEREQSENGTH
jgi:hypothetical protein